MNTCNPYLHPPCAVRHARQRGFVLIASLLILVVLTIISVAMFRSFGIQEKMAGNLREKAKAFELAQSALQQAEQWVQANATTGIPCSAGQVQAATSPRVCDQTSTLTDVNSLLLSSTSGSATGIVYQPASPTALSISQSGGANVYWQAPRYYIQYIGQGSSGNLLYRITSAAYGGNQNAVAIVQSIYAVGSGGATCTTC